MNRQAIYNALFALGSSVTWGAPASGFVYSSQRIRNWADQPDQPAFFQVAHDEEFVQQTGLPYRVVLSAKWMVYYNSAKDPDVAGSDLGNLIMDALQGALVPKITPGQPFSDRCTLGGLAYHACIQGQVFRDGGDLDGQGVIMVPVYVLVP